MTPLHRQKRHSRACPDRHRSAVAPPGLVLQTRGSIHRAARVQPLRVAPGRGRILDGGRLTSDVSVSAKQKPKVPKVSPSNTRRGTVTSPQSLMGALLYLLVDKTSRFLTWTHTLYPVSSRKRCVSEPLTNNNVCMQKCAHITPAHSDARAHQRNPPPLGGS